MPPQVIETLNTVGVGVLCAVLGIVALAIFFTALQRFSNEGASPETLAVRGVLKKDTWATVHMQGGETFERVKFVGFTADNIKTRLPWELHSMAIIEEAAGTRFLIRAKAIKMIVIAPQDSEWDAARGLPQA